jgi:hypothetical protein
MFHPLMDIKTTRDGVASRRSFLRHIAAGAGVAGFGALGWRDAVVAQAAELRKRGMACILLWMGGGPSQFETFDPKPGVPTGGPTQAISTAVPGIHIAQGWEQTAKMMSEIAIIRSMTHKEGEHERATYRLHTGYNPSPAVRHPTLGSLVSSELAAAENDLPHFVRITGNSSATSTLGAGFLGSSVAPFTVTNPMKMPTNIALPGGVDAERFDRRLQLGKELAEEFAADGARAIAEEHQKLYDRAARMVRSTELDAFSLTGEKDALRDRYGRNPFGQGCLLARRLIEHGVTFVEVASHHPDASAGWDTHIDNFAVTSKLVSWVDPGYATLISDLKERGMLDKTLIIWMGEFGRTPKINNRGATGGRDHYPAAFNVALAGGGIKGGQVIGSTDKNGVEVAERAVTVPDLFSTFCHSLGINAKKKNLGPGGLPVKVVDGGTPVTELFG